MKIAIVEDEKIHQDYLAAMLKGVAKDYGMVLSLRVFDSAEAFLFAFEEEKVDAVLLDIQLKTMNGYVLAEIIRQRDKNIPLAFITGIKDYVFDGYNVDACGYILKPIKMESVYQLMNKIIKKLSSVEKSLIVKTKDGIINLYENDIYYIESSNHSTILHINKGSYVSNTKLREWVEELSKESFFKVHRCYIINLGMIEKIEKTEVLMNNDTEIPIARGMWEELMRAYLAYRRKVYH
ncbi:LytR/AlgR family response regulator transcription factor [Clostridium algidicarnis]|uniref:LytR/AlgR family response regulator transcription factor n=1 Tax=Clostridium algidicarnis TaxID=37659 RepID=UPI0016249C77|nr:LytTR family DNA-binding domain-containing protein [Clostridium algidicarnis]MBB6632422.1 response regulator transcription factor [Clostridium algidicarnis]